MGAVEVALLILLWACTQTPEPPPPTMAPGSALPAAPARLGSPASSARARPGWASGRMAYAPQPESADALLQQAKLQTSPASIEGGLLACEVQALQFDGIKLKFGPFETKNLADLRVYLSFGDSLGEQDESATADGPRNANSATVVAPLWVSGKDERVQIAVYDRDILVDDHIVTLNGRFSGSYPITMAGDRGSASCWGLPRQVAEDAAAPRLQAGIDALIYQEQAWIPDIARDDMGITMRSPMPVPPIEAAAAYLGWDDPRVSQLTHSYDALQARFQQALLVQLSDAERGLPPVGTPQSANGSTISLLGLRCGKLTFPPKSKFQADTSPMADDECTVVLRVENTGPLEVPLNPDYADGPLSSVMVVDEEGHTLGLELRGQVIDHKLQAVPGPLAPGGSAVLVFARTDPPAKPWLLRLRAGSLDGQNRWMLLRLQ